MEYELRQFGVTDYDDFIQWGFSENPSSKDLDKVPALWKHQNECPIHLNNSTTFSLQRMAEYYLRCKLSPALQGQKRRSG